MGAINESDILLASTAGAIIVGFNVRPDAAAAASAQRSNVDMRFYRVIYDAIDEIEAAMCWVMPPASPAVTEVFRMASSVEVLPWST